MIIARKLVIAFLFFLSPIAGISQPDSIADSHFRKALNLAEKEKWDSALIVFKQIVEGRVGFGTYVYGNSFFNIPTIYAMLGKIDDARTWYKKVLAADVKDNDETGDLMEPHTNYKHKSAMRLASLAEYDSNYVEALEWLEKADTMYKYWGFVGSNTNVSKKKAVIVDWKAELMSLLDQRQKAIFTILKELISSGSLEGFFNKAESQLMHLLGSERGVFMSALDHAINTATITVKDEVRTLVQFELKGFSYTIVFSKAYPDRYIPHYWSMVMISKDRVITKEYFVEYVKTRNFYKRLAQ